MVVTAAAVGALAVGASSASAPDVLLDTEAGVMLLMLDYEAAPTTACNFAAYVARGDYNHGAFFRAVVAQTNDNPFPIDVVQAATPRGASDAAYPPIALERTRDTGLRHTAGAVSMARDGPDSATSSFFVVTQDAPSLGYGGGRNPDGQGFAVFGQLVSGLEVARAINAMPTDGREQLVPPIRINSATLLRPAPEICRR